MYTSVDTLHLGFPYFGGSYIFFLNLLFSRGLKTYLSKWKGKGFDPDLKKLTGILEAGGVAQAHLLVCRENMFMLVICNVINV